MQRVKVLTYNICAAIIGFQSVNHVQNLHDILLPQSNSTEEDLERAIERETRLSQKDRWENNGATHLLQRWSLQRRQTLLWIAGRCGNQDTWVTDLSVDIIQAMKGQEMVILFVLCSDSMTGPLKSITIVKRFIAQLLEQRPDLVFRHPKICNARIFRQAVTIKRVWKIFETLIKECKESLIIIDRIDQALDDETTQVDFDLLPRLIDLSAQYSAIDVIASSLYAPHEQVDIESNDLITKIMIDTTIAPFKRIDR